VLSRTYDLQSKSDLADNMQLSNDQGKVSVILLKLSLEMSWEKAGSLDEMLGLSTLDCVKKSSIKMTFSC
jgi:hypothetical protein